MRRNKKQVEYIENPIGISLDKDWENSNQRLWIGQIPELKQNDNSHPTPEQLLMREALKILEPKQLKVWEMWNYNRLTQDEIAKEFKVSRQAIAKQIKVIEGLLAKWVKSNMGAYQLLKGDLEK